MSRRNVRTLNRWPEEYSRKFRPSPRPRAEPRREKKNAPRKGGFLYCFVVFLIIVIWLICLVPMGAASLIFITHGICPEATILICGGLILILLLGIPSLFLLKGFRHG